MLNESRMKVYINAYTVRLQRGEKLEDIDKDYIEMKRLTEKDVKEIHSKLRV